MANCIKITLIYICVMRISCYICRNYKQGNDWSKSKEIIGRGSCKVVWKFTGRDAGEAIMKSIYRTATTTRDRAQSNPFPLSARFIM